MTSLAWTPTVKLPLSSFMDMCTSRTMKRVYIITESQCSHLQGHIGPMPGCKSTKSQTGDTSLQMPLGITERDTSTSTRLKRVERGRSATATTGATEMMA